VVVILDFDFVHATPGVEIRRFSLSM